MNEKKTNVDMNEKKTNHIRSRTLFSFGRLTQRQRHTATAPAAALRTTTLGPQSPRAVGAKGGRELLAGCCSLRRGTSCVQERGRAAGTWPKPPASTLAAFLSQGSQPSGARKASANAERTNHGASPVGCVEAPCADGCPLVNLCLCLCFVCGNTREREASQEPRNCILYWTTPVIRGIAPLGLAPCRRPRRAASLSCHAHR